MRRQSSSGGIGAFDCKLASNSQTPGSLWTDDACEDDEPMLESDEPVFEEPLQAWEENWPSVLELQLVGVLLSAPACAVDSCEAGSASSFGLGVALKPAKLESKVR